MGLAVVLLVWAGVARGQYETPAESMVMRGTTAYTWTEEQTTIVMLEGPISIDLDKNRLSADSAVIWISQVPRTLIDLQRVEIALIGHAKLVQGDDVTRSGGKLYVDARLRGPISLVVDKRVAGDHSDAELYRTSLEMRPRMIRGAQPGRRWTIEEEQPATRPATTQPLQRRPLEPVHISFSEMHTIVTPQEKVAVVLSGKVALIQRARNGDLLELQADRAVVFTPYTDLRQIQGAGQLNAVEQAVTGAYLEGDVRIVRTPKSAKEGEARLTANRAYYDFTTDRAVLTDVVLQTTDPKSQIPITVRANVVRQLSLNEYTTEKSTLSTSQFATPSYSIGASKLYVRQVDEGDEVLGTRTIFRANDATFHLGDLPVFWTPYLAGSVTERNLLRRIETSGSSRFGFGVDTEWGLFETLGKVPPKGVDASYKLDYYAKRGPATGLFGKYIGGHVSETTLEPWSYSGDFKSYLVYDHGEDDLGKERVDVEPDSETRGWFYWRHQHFLPDDWQVQVTGGYISDPTFLEEWFSREFRTQGPHDTALYLKHQKDSEAFTFLASVQPNDFVTTSDLLQEQFEVERLPEFTYQRIGDSWLDDRLTFFSSNSVSALDFQKSHATLQELGFARAPHGYQSPGFPALGTPYLTHWDVPSDTTYRGDTREEVNFPFSMGQFRVVPYVMGRYTAYSQSVDGGQAERLYAGAGLRMTTAWWKVDDSYQSDLWDLHRLRHVVEPELNLYTAAQSKSADELLIYDEPIDNINDIGAVSLAINQRWQTKRGGPGNWRSVDFFTLNTEVNYFFNKPPDRDLRPLDFRGLYFVSRPETSIPRDSLNADWNWRISDHVTVLGDAQYNLSEALLSTASIGMSVHMDPRLNYFVGLRHVGVDISENDSVVINGNTFVFERQELGIFAIDYQLSTNYRLQLATSYDFAQHRNDRSTVTFIRHFDRFYAAISFRVDEFQGENAVFFNLWPEGLEPGGGTASAASTFGQ